MATALALRQNSIVTVQPASEPVTLAQARTQLGMEAADTSKDTELNRWIAAAHRYVENALGYPIITQTRQTHLRGFPASNGAIWIGAGAELTVDSVTYYDSVGASTVLNSANYIVDTASLPAEVVPAVNYSWPATQTRPGAVVIEWTAGWADGDDVLAYAPELIHAMLLLIGHWDLNREAVGTVTREMEFAVSALLRNHQVWKL